MKQEPNRQDCVKKFKLVFSSLVWAEIIQVGLS